MSSRHRGRERALQILYQVELTHKAPELTTSLFAKNRRQTAVDNGFTDQLVKGVREHQGEIDQMIANHAHNWKLSRMAPIDVNVLRIGVFELLFSDEVPANVAIDEAVELGKRFGNERTSGFVNGILDAIHREQP